MLPGRMRLLLASAWLNTLHVIAPRRAAHQAVGLFCTPARRNRPDEADGRVLAEAEVSRLTLAGAGAQVAVYRWPSPARSAAGRVLLAHGWESCAGRLGAWVGPLREAGYEVLGVDAPAHGASGGRRLTAVEYVEALQGAAGSGVDAVIGHSFGGLCAALAAGGVIGERLLRTGRLVLIASPADVDTLIGRFADLLSLRPALRADIRRAVEETAGRPLESFAVDDALARTTHCVLVVHDTRDEEVPFADGERVAGAARGADLYATTGLGHRRVARNPHVIRYVIDFIRAVG